MANGECRSSSRCCRASRSRPVTTGGGSTTSPSSTTSSTPTSDYTSFSLTAPLDPRLPNGAGTTRDALQRQPECGVADQQRHHAGQNYGTQIRLLQRHPAEPQRAAAQRAGLPGWVEQRNHADGQLRASGEHCPRTGARPTNPWCNTSTGWPPIHRPRLVHAAEGRRAAVGNVPERQGGQLAANYNVPNSQWRPRLGATCRTMAQFANVNLIEPGTLYGDRVNEIDLRLAEDLEVWQDENQRRLRPLQCPELGGRPQLQPDVQPDRQPPGWCQTRCFNRDSGSSASRSISRTKVSRTGDLGLNIPSLQPPVSTLLPQK